MCLLFSVLLQVTARYVSDPPLHATPPAVYVLDRDLSFVLEEDHSNTDWLSTVYLPMMRRRSLERLILCDRQQGLVPDYLELLEELCSKESFEREQHNRMSFYGFSLFGSILACSASSCT